MDEAPVVTSVRVPADMRLRYDELARLTGLTRNELILRAMGQYLEDQTLENALVEERLVQNESDEQHAWKDNNGYRLARRLLAAREGSDEEALLRAELADRLITERGSTPSPGGDAQAVFARLRRQRQSRASS